jgi:TonB family protein
VTTIFLSFFFFSTVASNGADLVCVRHVVVPDYPPLARMARLQGSVSVEVEIGADGKVLSVKSTGSHNLLASASASNAWQWTFRPAPPGGKSGSTYLTITYVYKLEGKEVNYLPTPSVTLDLPHKVEITTHPPQMQPEKATPFH